MPERTPLLLMPGLLCDAALWRGQLDGLADVADMTVASLFPQAAAVAGISFSPLLDRLIELALEK